MATRADVRGFMAAARARFRGRARGASFLGDLKVVLAERDFRRLFGTRLVSQSGDGMFTAGLGSYVFFNATTFPNPVKAAAAFAVLYLPYSLIGPFAGVIIDRCSRRQILVWSALLRAVFVVFTAALVASGNLGPPLYVSVLAVLGVDRFFLSSLSAALPHVVAEDKLVMANAVAPTSGTVVSFLGGFAGLGIHLATGGGRGGSAVTLLVAGGCYLAAGAVGATIPRDMLGPDKAEARRRAGVLEEWWAIAVGLAAGARHVLRRRRAAAALLATGSQRAMYGILFLMSILLYRNYFYHSSANNALAHFTLVVVAAALGYGAAAVIVPVVSSWLPPASLIAILLVTAGVVCGPLGATFSQVPFLVISFALGLAAQGVAIAATTILQREVADDFRGRVFAFYDMLFNVPFVIGAAVSAAFMPPSGKSYLLVGVAGGGYVLAGLVYSLIIAQRPAGGPAPSSPATASPSASAHRSSS